MLYNTPRIGAFIAILICLLSLGCVPDQSGTHFSSGDKDTLPPEQNINSLQSVDSSESDSMTVHAAELFKLKFDKQQGVVLIPVKVLDREYLFLLDTGSNVHLYDSSLRHLLGKSVTIEINQSSIIPNDTQLFFPPKTMIGKASIELDRPVICADLRKIKEALGENVAGIIGMPFFRRNCVQIDYEKGEVNVLKFSKNNPTDLGEMFPVNFDALGSPTIAASINHKKVRGFLLDTGANTTGSLQESDFDGVVNQESLYLTGTQTLATAIGIIHRPKGRLREFSVGPFNHKDLIFSKAETNMLGMRFLRRYLATFDIPNKRIFLKPSIHCWERDFDDLSGLSLTRLNGTVKVAGVTQGSPASKTSLRIGDTITTVGSLTTDDLSLAELRQILHSYPGRKISIGHRRSELETHSQVILQEEPWDSH